MELAKNQTSDLRRWIRAYYMVKSWILATMKPEIAESLVFVGLQRIYEKRWWKDMGKQILSNSFTLKNELNDLQQNDISLMNTIASVRLCGIKYQAFEGIPTCTYGVLESYKCNILKKLMELDC